MSNRDATTEAWIDRVLAWKEESREQRRYTVFENLDGFESSCATQPTPPCKLYRYLPPDRVSTLETETTVMSPPVAFNDPFDVFPDYSITALQIKQHLKEASRTCPMPPGIPRKERRQKLRNAAKESIRELQTTFAERQKQRIQEEFPWGLLCLSGTNTNLLMWAHYASAHTGFAVGFDCGSSSFKRLGACVSVIYSNTRPAISPYFKESWAYMRTKSVDWGYEQEYRIIRPLPLCQRIETNNGIRYLTPFPKQCISEIFLGCRSSPALEQRIIAATKGTTILIFKAHLSKSHFKVEFKPMNMPARLESSR